MNINHSKTVLSLQKSSIAIKQMIVSIEKLFKTKENLYLLQTVILSTSLVEKQFAFKILHARSAHYGFYPDHNL